MKYIIPYGFKLNGLRITVADKRFIYQECENCGGSGYIQYLDGYENTAGLHEVTKTCPECCGKGEFITDQYVYV